jgi:hypothetical protein
MSLTRALVLASQQMSGNVHLAAILKTTPCHIAFLSLISPRRFLPKSESVPREYWPVFDLAFSHSSCLRDVAWIRPACVLTKRGDVGTTSPTALIRQEPPPKQSKYSFASLQHHPPDYRSTPNTRKRKGCSWGPFKKGEGTHAQDGCDGNAWRMELRRR